MVDVEFAEVSVQEQIGSAVQMAEGVLALNELAAEQAAELGRLRRQVGELRLQVEVAQRERLSQQNGFADLLNGAWGLLSQVDAAGQGREWLGRVAWWREAAGRLDEVLESTSRPNAMLQLVKDCATAVCAADELADMVAGGLGLAEVTGGGVQRGPSWWSGVLARAGQVSLTEPLCRDSGCSLEHCVQCGWPLDGHTQGEAVACHRRRVMSAPPVVQQS